MSWHQFLIRDLEQWQSFGHRNKVRPLLWQIHQVVIYVICKKKPKLYIKDLLPFFIGIFGVVTVCGCSGTDKRWQVAVERRQASCTAGWKFSSVHLFLCFCPSSSNQANYSSRKESRGEERRVEERRGEEIGGAGEHTFTSRTAVKELTHSHTQGLSPCVLIILMHHWHRTPLIKMCCSKSCFTVVVHAAVFGVRHIILASACILFGVHKPYGKRNINRWNMLSGLNHRRGKQV